MITLLYKRLRTEYQHWLRLQPAGRQFLASVALFEVTVPIVYVFINAFLFRSTNDFNSLGLYNLGWFLTVTIGFYINGWLAKKFHISKIMTLGAVGQGLIVLLLFWMKSFPWWLIFSFGLAIGFPIAFYWANRNYLELTLTTDETRNYFKGIQSLLSRVAGFLTPLVVSGIVGFSLSTGGIEIDKAYQLLGLATVFLLGLSGMVLNNLPVEPLKWRRIWIGRADATWNWSRAVTVLHGVEDGLRFVLPTLLVFIFLGNEVTLGVLEAGLTILMATVTYIYARKSKIHHRLKLLSSALAWVIASELVFSGFPSPVTALTYYGLIGVAGSLTWMAISPILQKVIDDQDGGNPQDNYAFVADEELFLNIGRVLGMAGFFGVVHFVDQVSTLRLLSLGLAAIHVGLLLATRRLVSLSGSRYNGG